LQIQISPSPVEYSPAHLLPFVTLQPANKSKSSKPSGIPTHSNLLPFVIHHSLPTHPQIHPSPPPTFQAFKPSTLQGKSITTQATHLQPQAQTPTQRRANEKHAKSVEKRMGKPETAYKKKEVKKSPVSIGIVGMLTLMDPFPAFLSLSRP
jgi:hypothetical protein